jgi:hypothetical protein
MNDELEYRIARRKVIRRLILRVSFVINLIFFALLIPLLIQEIPKASENLIGVIIFVLIYGTFLLFHGGAAFNLFGRFIDRATSQELERQSRYEKPKRSTLAVGEDGELVEVEDEEWEGDERVKHGANSYR